MIAICSSQPCKAESSLEAAPAAKSTAAFDYLMEGSVHYRNRDYQKAIELYQKVLSLEKKQPSLGMTWWRVLVDNLGMSYGITGDLAHAKETFEYGLSKDPLYPIFHYNMACVYAGLNDEEKAIAYLKSAFKYRENIIKGEQMPDPAADDSFAHYMKDEKFLKALKELGQH
jgi:tetratricopeptide (TPR) repeat protein